MCFSPRPAVLAWLTAHWLTRGRVRLVWPLSLQLNSSSWTAVNINEYRVSSIWDRVLDAVPVLLCSQRAPHHQPVPATSPCCPWCLAAAWSLRVYVVSANQSFINQTADLFVSQCDHGYHSKKTKTQIRFLPSSLLNVYIASAIKKLHISELTNLSLYRSLCAASSQQRQPHQSNSHSIHLQHKTKYIKLYTCSHPVSWLLHHNNQINQLWPASSLSVCYFCTSQLNS